MKMAWPTCRRLLAHFTRLVCSRARLSGGSSSTTSNRISSAAPPTDSAPTIHPLIFRGLGAADVAAGAAGRCTAGIHARDAGIATGVRLSALNGLAQLLHDSVRPR